MQKFLISSLCATTLLIGGCSTMEDMGNAVPNLLGDTSLVYKPQVQQGNVVTQEMVDKLEPGMNRRQVEYILGTPLLVDAFHQDRWDYIYTRERGGGTANRERVALYFEDDTLVRVEGDYRPQPKEDPLADAPETVFSVPDYKKKDKGFFTKTLEAMGVDTDEVESTPSAAGLGKDDKLPNLEKDERLPETAEEAMQQANSQTTQQHPEEIATQDVQVDNAPVQEEQQEEKGFFSRTLEVFGF